MNSKERCSGLAFYDKSYYVEKNLIFSIKLKTNKNNRQSFISSGGKKLINHF